MPDAMMDAIIAAARSTASLCPACWDTTDVRTRVCKVTTAYYQCMCGRRYGLPLVVEAFQLAALNAQIQWRARALGNVLDPEHSFDRARLVQGLRDSGWKFPDELLCLRCWLPTHPDAEGAFTCDWGHTLELPLEATRADIEGLRDALRAEAPQCLRPYFRPDLLSSVLIRRYLLRRMRRYRKFTFGQRTGIVAAGRQRLPRTPAVSGIFSA